jgi:hypothetical protein
MPPALRRRPSAAMVVALLALFVALDGPATAARLIDGRSISSNSITTRQVRNHTLVTRDLSAAAVRALQATPARSVGARQLRTGAVDATRLADGAVGSAKLAGKAVDGSKIADGAVGAAQLAPGAVGTSRVADGAIGAAAVADGGLQTRDVGDFYGLVSTSFGDFHPNQCKVISVAAQPSSPAALNSIADDVVAVSPSTTGWPDPIIVTANPGANNTIRIIACRIGGTAPDDPPILSTPPTTFQYVAVDTP